MVRAYYPHWAGRSGEVTEDILASLPRGTMVGLHHNADSETVQLVLASDRDLMVSWYAECNLVEDEDEMPHGYPVKKRIHQAATHNKTIPGHARANLMELDAARYKHAGELGDYKGLNGYAGFIADTKDVKAAGFKYLAKSPSFDMLDTIINDHGDAFVPHIVYEDFLVDEDYRTDAARIRKKWPRIPITVVIHSGAYGGAPGTTKAKAQAYVDSLKAGDMIEVWYGKPVGAVHLRAFPAAPAVASVPTARPTKTHALDHTTWTKEANLRGTPALDGPILAKIPGGVGFNVIRKHGDFYAVDFTGDDLADGWFHKSLVI